MWCLSEMGLVHLYNYPTLHPFFYKWHDFVPSLWLKTVPVSLSFPILVTHELCNMAAVTRAVVSTNVQVSVWSWLGCPPIKSPRSGMAGSSRLVFVRPPYWLSFKKHVERCYSWHLTTVSSTQKTQPPVRYAAWARWKWSHPIPTWVKHVSSSLLCLPKQHRQLHIPRWLLWNLLEA